MCEGCAALEIECLYSETRPSWMDNGPRQRAMADRLKLAVKDRAAWRREKRFLRDIETGAAAIRLGEADDDFASGMVNGGSGGIGGATHIFSVDSLGGANGNNSSSSSSSNNSMMDRPASPPSTASPSDSSGAEHHAPGPGIGAAATGPSTANTTPAGIPSNMPAAAWTPEASLAPPNLEQERELNLMMMYLDYVFPFLYPFCRPTVLGSGRGWLLVLLMKNKAVFHSALSLSSYFLAVVANTTHALNHIKLTNDNSANPTQATAATTTATTTSTPATVSEAIDRGMDSRGHTAGNHGTCLVAMASELHKQQELSLRELQRTIACISVNPTPTTACPSSGSESRLAHSARALESILQLLSFEGLLQRFDRWHVHLDAALALFEQTMQQYGATTLEDGSPAPNGGGWPAIMHQLSPFHDSLTAQTLAFPVPYGSDQAALKFYASLLLYMDIVTSTVTETPPRLQQYHKALLGTSEGDGDAPGARSSFVMFDPAKSTLLAAHEVVGIRNWVLLALADTAALAVWKKEAAAARRLTVSELLVRAAPIEQRLRTNLQQLEQKMKMPKTHFSYDSGEPPLPSGFYSRFIAAAEAQLDEALAERQNECRDQEQDPHNHHNHNNRQNDPSLPAAPHADYAAHLSVDTVSHIWGLAVLTYLKVVVNGWQPAADDVRETADALLRELAALPSASCLRVAAWPLCVAGCLAASPQQRAIYPGMVGEICGGELFGTVNEALRIMRAVWAAQDLQALGGGGAGSVHVEWDFARCFNILGRRAYLF